MPEQQSSARRDRSASSELSDAPIPSSKSSSKKPEQILVSSSSQTYVAKPSAKKTAAGGKASSSKQANGKDVKQSNGSSSKRASTVVARSRVFWGRKAQVDCDYEVEGPIKDDWQVAYVWAFLIKFRRDNVPADAERFQKTNVITELKTVDEFETSLKSEVPDEGLTEALVVLVRPLWRAMADALEDKEKKDLLRRKGVKAKHTPSKALLGLREAINRDNIIDKLSHLIDDRLKPGCPLSVFDAYIFSKTEHYDTEESAKEADILAAKDVNTLEYREMKENDPLSDRSENNPLRSQGFWTSPWSVKIKIMRQLVDWNLSDTDVHDTITQTRTKGKVPTLYDINRADKGSEQQHWQVIEDTWRVYGIKKPLQIHGSTITCASTKEEYYDLMNRHLAKEQQLPDMKKEQALASSKSKAVQLRNAAILAERDVDFGKFLQGRVEGIEAKFEEFERQREALLLKKAKAAEREAREARRIASLPIITNYGRATRSRTKVNYSEQNDEVDDDDDGKIEYRSRRDRNGDNSDAGDYRSSSAEAEAPAHGRNTRNSRTSALTTVHGYATRGTTASTFGDIDGDASRAATESANEDEEAMQEDDASDIEEISDGDGRKRRHSDVDHDEEDEPATKKIHLDDQDDQPEEE